MTEVEKLQTHVAALRAALEEARPYIPCPCPLSYGKPHSDFLNCPLRSAQRALAATPEQSLAALPDRVRELEAIVASQDVEIADKLLFIEHLQTSYNDACKALNQSCKRIGELEEVLEVYADRENWLDDTDGRLPIVEVGPTPAREALERKVNA